MFCNKNFVATSFSQAGMSLSLQPLPSKQLSEMAWPDLRLPCYAGLELASSQRPQVSPFRGSTDTYRVYYMYLVLLSELAGLKVGNALS